MKRCLLLVALALSSCQLVHRVSDSASELFGDDVVARLGEHRLLRSTLEAYIPAGMPPDDSLALSRQYINAWAEDLLFLDMAEARLSKEEKDVSRELEEYRRTLLRYRYEDRYINERLDTLVSEGEIRAYYQEHQDRFLLERPLLKARYLVIPPGSRSLKVFKELMASDNPTDSAAADSLAVTTALRYVDLSHTWTDALLLARELGTDDVAMMKSLKKHFIEFKGDDGNLRVAFVADIAQKGSPAPLEYCAERIGDIILSARKHELVSGLEQDLLTDARNKEKLVIY